MTAGRKTRLRVLQSGHVGPEGHGIAGLITLVRLVGRMTGALSNIVRPHGLTVAHFEVLICLHRGEGISQQELAERLLVTKGNICIVLQKMESEGLIQRIVDEIDQRCQRVYLTSAGRKRLAAVMPQHNTQMKCLAAALTPDEQIAFHSMLCRIEQALEDQEK